MGGMALQHKLQKNLNIAHKSRANFRHYLTV